jgi:hypothetical protein
MSPTRRRPIDRSGIEPLEPRTLPSCVINTAAGYRLWPTNQIPYVIDPALKNSGAVVQAINLYNDETNLQWIPRTNQADYVEFSGLPAHDMGEGLATVGFAGGPQDIWLSSDVGEAIVLHEMGHALGLLHEQQRNDASNYIVFHSENMSMGSGEWFSPVGNEGVDVGPFDFSSIMLYASDAFSGNGQPTMTRLDGTTWAAAKTLSAEDISTLDSLYPVPSGQAQVAGQVVATLLSGNQVQLTWKDTNAGQATYTVERAVAGQSFQAIATLPAGSTSYVDNHVPAADLYQYLIVATTAANVPAVSAIVYASTIAPPTLVAKWDPSGQQVLLTWNDVFDGRANYDVEISQNGGPFLDSWPILDAGTTSDTWPLYGSDVSEQHYDFRIHAQLGDDPPLWVSNESNTAGVGTPWEKVAIQVTASSTSTVLGQPITLTATVAAVPPGSGVPTGQVDFYVWFIPGSRAGGGAILGSAPLNVVNGVDEATLTTTRLPGPGLNPIQVQYTVYESAPFYVTTSWPSNWGAPPFTPLRIIGALVLDTGKSKHKRRGGFELMFNEGVRSDRAVDPANYTVTETVKRGRKLISQPVNVRIEYNPGAYAVSLIPEGKPRFTRGGQIVVSGMAPGGITSVWGGYLDGPGTGPPGHNAVLVILPGGRKVTQ